MGDKPEIQVVDPVLQGRAGQMPNAKGEQMFCSFVSDREDRTTIEDFVDLTPGWTTDQARRPESLVQSCQRLWVINARGTEIYRFSNSTVAPLSLQVIQNGPLPAGAVRSDNINTYRLRIKTSTETGYAIFYIDFNQELEVWAHRIEATVVGPPNALSVPSFIPETMRKNGIVVDSHLGCQIVPIESSKGNREATLTEYLRCAAGAQATLRVPRSARAIKVYQGFPNTAPATVQWSKFQGEMTTSPIEVGKINFNNRVSDDASASIGPENIIQTDLEPASERLFIVHWTIRP